ncbi:hypothetical protein Pcinc_022257 [Petrolisthes cinctipes]|uniref:Uncharacterized protein n=1 Tax=Petrolisthes cinctipes TaxID=88211 RepID=A0AAE1FF48_PETCI|nr:hypothetical protein Pcinc_022257 [Petrolisthes cinctipes]
MPRHPASTSPLIHTTTPHQTTQPRRPFTHFLSSLPSSSLPSSSLPSLPSTSPIVNPSPLAYRHFLSTYPNTPLSSFHSSSTHFTHTPPPSLTLPPPPPSTLLPSPPTHPIQPLPHPTTSPTVHHPLHLPPPPSGQARVLVLPVVDSFLPALQSLITH